MLNYKRVSYIEAFCMVVSIVMELPQASIGWFINGKNKSKIHLEMVYEWVGYL